MRNLNKLKFQVIDETEGTISYITYRKLKKAILKENADNVMDDVISKLSAFTDHIGGMISDLRDVVDKNYKFSKQRATKESVKKLQMINKELENKIDKLETKAAVLEGANEDLENRMKQLEEKLVKLEG